jgi:uncharacterized membrane protein
MDTLLIAITVLSTGLMAGIFLTWTNAVTPGIGKLNDLGYLSALQAMNRVILNPLFYIVFILPVLSLPILTAFNISTSGIYNSKLLFLATIIYWTGALLITLLGNIPLNELLNHTTLEKLSTGELSYLRDKIEVKWNTFNLIRTISSFSSFLFLILSLILRK